MLLGRCILQCTYASYVHARALQHVQASKCSVAILWMMSVKYTRLRLNVTGIAANAVSADSALAFSTRLIRPMANFPLKPENR